MGLWDQRGGLLSRLFPPVIEPPTKAATGRGAVVLETGTMLSSLTKARRDSGKWLTRAQALSHAVPFIERAERTISGRGAAVPWHLEDGDDNTVDDEAAPEYQAIRDLLENPMIGGQKATWRQLTKLTLRHMGVCNVAAWFLDQRDLVAGTPLTIHYLNPARLTPRRDDSGRLTHWSLDAEVDYFGTGEGGQRLELDEVVLFVQEPPDIGVFGVGLVEAAETKIAIAKASDRYVTGTLESGGRRGHFISPPAGERMPDEVFDALVAGLRNVADHPDAVKRNIVTKGPIDATPQALTPNEIGIADILERGRDDLLVLWGVDPLEIGVSGPGGLNSGGIRAEAKRSTWENGIQPRMDVLREVVQLRLLDRWKGLGVPVELVFDYPTFEDRTPAFDLFLKSIDAPLRNKERRELLGYDPTGNDEFDNAIWMGTRLTEVTIIDDEGNVTEPEEPEPLPPGQMPVMPNMPPPNGTPPAAPPPGKAVVRAPFGRLRSATERQSPLLARSVAAALREVKADVLKRLRDKAGHLLKKPDDLTAWWQDERVDASLRKAIRPRMEAVAVEVTSRARDVLDTPKKADDDFADRVLDFVLRRGGERITGMVGTTRDAVLDAIRPVLAEAAESGLGPADVADRLTDAVGGLAVWDDARAELIARTETMLAYNDAALGSFREFGVTEVEAIDGDEDDECAARNGQRFPLDEALGITDHPNGTLDWLPVVA